MDNFLILGEFMVFRYNGYYFFDVLILGINGCERKLVEEEEVDIYGELEVDEEEIDEGKFRDVLGKKKGKLFESYFKDLCNVNFLILLFVGCVGACDICIIGCLIIVSVLKYILGVGIENL